MAKTKAKKTHQPQTTAQSLSEPDGKDDTSSYPGERASIYHSA
jgi:hypothetical protein